MSSDSPASRASNNPLQAGVNFVEGLGRGAVMQSVDSVEQIWDEIRGKPISIPKPDNSQGGLAGEAGDAGEAIGKALPLVGAAVLMNRYLPMENRALAFSSGVGLGFGYSMLFSPVNDPNKNFWSEKLGNAASLGLTLGTMNTFFRAPAAGESRLANLQSGAVAGLKGGLLGGAVNAESTSLFQNHTLASPDKLLTSALTYGIAGLTLGGAGGAFSKSAIGTSDSAETAETARAAGQTPALGAERESSLMPAAASARDTDEGFARMSNPNDAGAPTIGRDDEGNVVVMTKDGLAATYKNGEWFPGLQFSSRKIQNLDQVTDPDERQLILGQAQEALKKFADMHRQS